MPSWKVAYQGGPSPTRTDRQETVFVDPNVGPLDPRGDSQSPPVDEPSPNTADSVNEDIQNDVAGAESTRNKRMQPTAAVNTQAFVEDVFYYVGINQAAIAAFHNLMPLAPVFAYGDVPRDVLLGKAPKEVELLVKLDPAHIREILASVPGSKLHGDGREVNFSLGNDSVKVIAEESKSFTADNIAVDMATGEIIDRAGGMQDIELGILRHLSDEEFTGNPQKILEALKMFSDHGLTPADETMMAMVQLSPVIEHMQPEEKRDVILGILKGKNPSDSIRLADDAGILQYILPEVHAAFGFDLKKPNQVHDLGTHLLDVLDYVSQLTSSVDLRMAALLHDIAKLKVQKIEKGGHVHYPDHDKVGARMSEDILKNLRFPATDINYICSIIAHHKFPDFNTIRGAHKFLTSVGNDDEMAHDLLTFRLADREDKKDHGMVPFFVNNERKLLDEVLKEKEVGLGDLNINEFDVAHVLKIKGPEVKDVLNKILNLVKDYPQLNTRSELMELLRGMQNG